MKVFDFVSEGADAIRIVQRSRKVVQEIFAGTTMVAWLAITVDACTLLVGGKEFFKTFHEWSRSYLAQ